MTIHTTRAILDSIPKNAGDIGNNNRINIELQMTPNKDMAFLNGDTLWMAGSIIVVDDHLNK